MRQMRQRAKRGLARENHCYQLASRRPSLRSPTLALLVSPMMRACFHAERDVSDEKCPVF